MIESTTFATRSVGNTLLMMWHSLPGAGELRVGFDELRRLSTRFPDGVYLLLIVTRSVSMPNADVRNALRTAFETMRGRLQAVTVAIEHEDVTATLARSIFSSIMTLAKHPCPLRTYSRRKEAAVWQAGLPASPTLTSLEAAMATLDSQLCASVSRLAATKRRHEESA